MMGQTTFSAGFLMIQNWEECLISQEIVLPSRKTSAGWRNGRQEPHEVQQGEMQSLAPVEEQHPLPVHAGGYLPGKYKLNMC